MRSASMLLLVQLLQEAGRQAQLCILWRCPMEGSSVPNVQRATPNRPQSSDTSKRSIWPSPTGAMCAAIAGRSTRELVTSETTWKRPTSTPRPWWTPRASRDFENKISWKWKWKKTSKSRETSPPCPVSSLQVHSATSHLHQHYSWRKIRPY